ncbi:MAG: hypothetical protein M3R17_02705 [Bacteroidota bacterium]|nr:hypothetical protein [Bacteroidota bacterium]
MKKENHTKQMLRDLNLWIDSYDDLFSDFDSRPLSERGISDDFISELNKLIPEKEGFIETLRFQVPAKVRDEKTEAIIIDRLSKDFSRHYLRFTDEVDANRKKGILMTFFGIAALITAVLIISLGENVIWQNTLKVLFEPAGWFLVWSGLDKIFFGGKSVKQRREHYARLEKSKVEFVSFK